MIHNKKVLAFIPGKTGSVGLPDKLFKTIGSLSLLEWTLVAACQSKCIDTIIVSSNDIKIKNMVENFKSINYDKHDIRFIQRPDELCTPTSKTEDAISHMFANDPMLQQTYHYLVMLQGTSPARRNNLVDSCIKNLGNSFDDYESLITVEKTVPFFWRINDEVGTSYPEYSLRNRPMRQELQECDFYYKDTGNIYITKTGEFLLSRLRVSGRTMLYQTDKFESMQIDTIEDFIMMETMFEYYGNFV